MGFDPIIIMEQIQSFPCRVELFFEESGIIAGEATGFFVFLNGSQYFVTNRHVFVGKDSTTNRYLHSSGLEPDHMRIYSQRDIENPFVIELINEYGDRKYLLHPDDSIDIGVIETNFKNNYILSLDTDSPLLYFPLSPDIGEEVSVIGYPTVHKKFQGQVILKNCNIASKNGNFFMINGLTTSGMSGSPVFLIKKNGFMTTNYSFINNGSTGAKFIGIYAQRINKGGKKVKPSTIGIVFKPELITECILRM